MAIGRSVGDAGPFPDGAWGCDRAHFPKPVTTATAGVLVGRLSAEAAERWGLLLAGVDFAVDADRWGWVYVREQPVTDGDVARARAAAATATVRRRRWLEDLARWESTTRPAIVDELLGLQDEPLSACGAEALAGHLRRTVTTARRLFDLHMELHLADMVPLGALLAAGEAWGLAPGEIIGLMRGSSPASTASAELVAARAAGGDLDSHEVQHLLRFEGHHLVSEPEVATPTLHERPDLVRALLRAIPPSDPAPCAIEPIRMRVPADERDRFDDLLADARQTFGLRDDNTRLTAMWPMGLVRRAYLEAARRLPSLEDPDDVFHLDAVEATAALTGTGTGDEHEVAARRRRAWHDAFRSPPPGHIGQWAPTDIGLMSDDQRWLHAAFDAYNDHFGSAGDEPLTGIGIAGQVVTGPAVVAVSPLDALDRIGPDSILVVAATAPAYDSVLPLVRGLVVETGGLLSHAALTGRELGLPVIVGVVDATRLIVDGDLVTVDPVQGRVSREANSSSTMR